MFDSQENSDSSRCISTVTLLALGFIFSPALVILSQPAGYLPASLAAVFSTLCVLIVWLNRKKRRK